MNDCISRGDALAVVQYNPNPVEGIKELPAAYLVEVVRCDECVLHGSCLTEDTFKIARIENPFCCIGKGKEQ